MRAMRQEANNRNRLTKKQKQINNMAVLGKIRERSLLLIGIIGFALFAFIAEEMVRSCESSRAEQSQRAGEVNGKKLDVQTFNKMVEEYTDVMKVMQGTESLSNDQMAQINDMVWNQYVSEQLLNEECEKLGLTVTDKEFQNMLVEGTNPMLSQLSFFANQQTGKFDVNMLKQFLSEYDKAKAANPQQAEQMKPLYTVWNFFQKQIRNQLLQQKYQTLVAGCMSVTSELVAKATFDGTNEESKIDLVAVPYSSINDKDVKLEDADYKAKYDELKNMFYRPEESRNIKYVDFLITPSSKDMNSLKKEFEGYKNQLAGDSAAAVGDIVRKANSLISYNGLPKVKDAFPSEIQALIDTTGTGVSAVKELNGQMGHTMNVIKVINKVSLPDSVSFRLIAVAGEDKAKMSTQADSIKDAIANGGDFETIAKKYGQTGEERTMVSTQLAMAQDLSQKDLEKYFNALLKGAKGDVQKVELSNATLVLKVTEQKSPKDMYDVAVITKTIEFSSETRQDAYNKFSAYVAKCKNLDDLKKFAKENGYEVKDGAVSKTSHNVAGINSTKEVLRWIFDADTEIGDMYTKNLECGDNGDHLMVAVLDKINKEGYADLSDADVKNYLKPLVLNDKKAEMILAKAKNMNDAKKQKGMKTATVEQITFAAPAFIQALNATEPALSGAVAATAKGKECKNAVKGNAGIYWFKVLDKKNLGNKYDKKATIQQLQQQAVMASQQCIQELRLNADIKDNRYLFF